MAIIKNTRGSKSNRKSINQKKISFIVAGILATLGFFSILGYAFLNKDVNQASAAGLNLINIPRAQTLSSTKSTSLNSSTIKSSTSNSSTSINQLNSSKTSQSGISSSITANQINNNKSSYFLITSQFPGFDEIMSGVFTYNPSTQTASWSLKPSPCLKITSSNLTLSQKFLYRGGSKVYIPDTYIVTIVYTTTQANCDINRNFFNGSQSLSLNNTAISYLSTNSSNATITLAKQGAGSQVTIVGGYNKNYIGDFTNDNDLCASNFPNLNLTGKCGLPYPFDQGL